MEALPPDDTGTRPPKTPTRRTSAAARALWVAALAESSPPSSSDGESEMSDEADDERGNAEETYEESAQAMSTVTATSTAAPSPQSKRKGKLKRATTSHQGDDDEEGDGRAGTSRKKARRVGSTTSGSDLDAVRRKPIKREASPDESDAPEQKKRRPSTATKQPPWTTAEQEALRNIWEEGQEKGWPMSKVYAQYRIFAEKKRWPSRQPGGCRGQVKKFRAGGDPTVKWSVEETKMITKLHAQGKGAKEIAEEHAKVFGATRRHRSSRAVSEKLIALAAGHEADDLPSDASEQAAPVPNKQAAAVGTVTTRKAYWTSAEDAVVLKYQTASLLEIKKELDRLPREGTSLREPRTTSAIQARLSKLKSLRVPLVYQSRRLWTARDDEYVQRVVAQGSRKKDAVNAIVKETGIQPTFALRRWQYFRKKRPEDQSLDAGASPVPVTDPDRASEEEADAQEADELRASRPDAWADTDYYPSGPSGDESEGEEPAPFDPLAYAPDRASLSAIVPWVEPLTPTDLITQSEVCLTATERVEGIRSADPESGEQQGPGPARVGEEDIRLKQEVQETLDFMMATVVQDARDAELRVVKSKSVPSIMVEEPQLRESSVTDEKVEVVPSSVSEETSTTMAPINEAPKTPTLTSSVEQEETPLTEPNPVVPMSPREGTQEPEVLITQWEDSTLEQASREREEHAQPEQPGLGGVVKERLRMRPDSGGDEAVEEASPSRTTHELVLNNLKGVSRSPQHSSDEGLAISTLGGEDGEIVEETPSEEAAQELILRRQVTVPMSPQYSDDEGATTVEARVAMAGMLIKYQDRGPYVRMVEATRNMIWKSLLGLSPELYELVIQYIKRDSERETSQTQFKFVGHTHFKPKVEFWELKSLLFGATMLSQDKGTLQVWLREMWESEYGVCRDPACCLFYHAANAKYKHSGICRHWEYLRKDQVYLDRFRDARDYLLAMALSVHRDAKIEVNATHQGKAQEGEETAVPVYIDLVVTGYGMASHLSNKWPAGIKEKMMDHVRPVFGLLTAVILHQTMNESTQGKPFLQTWDYGKLYYQDKSVYVRLGWAFSVHIGGAWVLLTDARVGDIDQHSRRLTWSPRGSIANYVRRLEAIERVTKAPRFMVELLANRDVGLQPRPEAERLRAVGTSTYLSMAGELPQASFKLDDDQLAVVKLALTHTGIVLARGPYGCGKTTLITKLVSAYLAAFSSKRIVIVSEANGAIEEDLERLITREKLKPRQLLRIGIARTKSGERQEVPEDRRPYYLKCILDDYRASLKIGAREHKDRVSVREKERELIDAAQVVVTTLSQLGKERYASQRFELVINDEGAHTLESSLLQAMGAEVETSIIVGDPLQIRPYSPTDERERDYFIGGERRHKLTWSAIHSLAHAHSQRHQNLDFPGVTMSAVFRSHPKITRFLAPFYEHPLRDRAKQSTDYLAQLQLPACLQMTNWKEDAVQQTAKIEQYTVSDQRVIWLSPSRSVTQAQERGCGDHPEAQNRANYVEAAAVLDLLLRIRRVFQEKAAQDGLEPEAAGLDRIPKEQKITVLVVTPYKSQVDLLNKLLTKYRYALSGYLVFDVATTDSSQGREAQIVVATMVRNKKLGFMRDYPARSLVSLSRARDYLFVLAAHAAYRQDTTWQDLLDNADRIKLPCFDLTWTPGEASERVAHVEQQCRLGGIRDEDYDFEEKQRLRETEEREALARQRAVEGREATRRERAAE